MVAMRKKSCGPQHWRWARSC